MRFIRNPRFGLLKFRTNGMLEPYVYGKLYKEARTLQDLPFVDIGAATGATSATVALAFKRSGNMSPVIGVEKCEGGSRDMYGGYDKNVAILKDNLRKYGVTSRVRLHTSALQEGDTTIWELIGGSQLSGFMHDADGRLYRDFGLFYEKTVPGGLIVVDDCPDGDSAENLLARGYTGKFVRSGTQWAWIEKMGLVEGIERVGDSDTVFARKPIKASGGATDFGELKSLADEVDRVLDEHSRREV